MKANIGDIVRGKDIGKSRSKNLYIYTRCPTCKLERWVDYFNWRKSNINGEIRCSICSARQQGQKNSAARRANKIIKV